MCIHAWLFFALYREVKSREGTYSSDRCKCICCQFLCFPFLFSSLPLLRYSLLRGATLSRRKKEREREDECLLCDERRRRSSCSSFVTPFEGRGKMGEEGLLPMLGEEVDKKVKFVNVLYLHIDHLTFSIL